MKRSKKLWLTTALTAAFLVLTGFASMNLSTERVDGAFTVTMTMMQGASVRLDENSGLKFAAKLDGYTEESAHTYGGMIVPYDYFARVGESISAGVDYVEVFTAAAGNSANGMKAPLVGENLTPVKGADGAYYIEYSIVGLYSENYHRKFFGVIFEQTENGRVYASNQDNVRSIMEVASGALNEFYYNENLETENKQIYDIYTLKEEELNGFVAKGVENNGVVGTDYTIATPDTIEAGEKVKLAVEIAGKPYAAFLPAWEADGVATIEKGVLQGLKSGTTTVMAANIWKDAEGKVQEIVAFKEITVTAATEKRAEMEVVAAAEELQLEYEQTWGAWTSGPITIAPEEGSGNTPPKYWEDPSLRMYKGNTLTVSCEEGYQLHSVELSGSSLDGNVNTNVGVMSAGEVTLPKDGEVQEVVFSIVGSIQITKVTVSYLWITPTTAAEKVATAKAAVEGLCITEETEEVPVLLEGVNLSWTSNNEAITVGTDGKLTMKKPAAGEADAEVTLTATLTCAYHGEEATATVVKGNIIVKAAQASGVEVTKTITFSDYIGETLADETNVGTVTIEGIRFMGESGEGTNSPVWYSTQLRIYNKNKLTISVDNATIRSIALNASGTSYLFQGSVSCGVFSTSGTTSTISAIDSSSVTLSSTSYSRILSITVTYVTVA